MGKRKHTRAKSNDDGMVYSTNPGYDWDAHDEEEDAEDWTVASCATLYVSVDRKQRAGKPVTVVEGFDGPAMELLALGKRLKASCGVGGSVKEGCVLVQGDQREKVLGLLDKEGFRTKRKGG